MFSIEQYQQWLRNIKQGAERAQQPLTWAHIVQASLAETGRRGPTAQRPLLREVLGEFDRKIIRFLNTPAVESGLTLQAISAIARALVGYETTLSSPSETIEQSILRWFSSGSAEPVDWTVDQLIPIFRRFGLHEGSFGAQDLIVSSSGISTQTVETQEWVRGKWHEQLSALVGLSTVKNDVNRLSKFLEVFKARQRRGLPTSKLPLHQVFFGNPGTGKTTVARILASAYRDLGFLERGHLIETDRSGLVGSVIGETEAKTTETIQRALGGVLFIDEAYALAIENQQDFGQRAIDTLVKAMEDHRDQLVVIVAGYQTEMERFLEANPGLYGRFNRHLHFPDYSLEELLEVFQLMAARERYVLAEGAAAHVNGVLAERKQRLGRRFGNARDTRTLWELCLQLQAERLYETHSTAAKLDEIPERVLLELQVADVPSTF